MNYVQQQFLEQCEMCGERVALFRLLVYPQLRCFKCVADDDSLPQGYRYKQEFEKSLPKNF